MKRARSPLCSCPLSPLLLACIGTSAPVGAQGTTAEERVFVEIDTARDSYYVQQPIRLLLRVGVDTRFLETSLIQPFRQELDVPLRIEAPWIDGLPGTVVLPVVAGAPAEGDAGADARAGPGRAARRRSLVLNDELTEAVRVEHRQVDARRYTVLEIERIVLPERAGTLAIPAPRVRFAYATRFRDDFFGDRVPEDRLDATVAGEPATLEIEPLPEAGRPPAFRGAVGSFRVRADADRHDVAVGESVKVSLHIEGEGNLAFFEPPRLDDVENARFHVFGTIDETHVTRRTVVYDIAPLSDTVAAVPPIPFAFFDPGPPAGYRTVRTSPIPLRVRPTPGGAPQIVAPPRIAAPSGPVPGDDDIFDIFEVSDVADVSGGSNRPGVTGAAPVAGAARALLEPGAREPHVAWLLGALAAPWLLALGLVSWRRARARRLGDPAGQRARRAAAAFRTRVGTADADLAIAFAEFLAARLRCPVAAVITPDLPARLRAAGVPRDVAARTSALLDELFTARFGETSRQVDTDETADLVDALEAAFTDREDPR